MERTVFNKAQLELLDIMSSVESDEELLELKHAISEFYAKKADEELMKLNLQDKLESLLQEEPCDIHYRTPYKR